MGLTSPTPPGALHPHFNIGAVIGPDTFVTKTGHPMMLAHLQAPDDECLSPAERNAAARRVEQAMRNFNDDDHLYQYLLKCNQPEIEHTTYNDPIVQQAVEGRLRHLTSRADRLYRQDRYLIVVHEGQSGAGRSGLTELLRDPKGSLERAFSKTKTITFFEDAINRQAAGLKSRFKSVQKQLEDVMQLKILEKEEAFQVLRRLVNYDPAKAQGKLAHNLYLDYQLCQSSLECYRDRLELDGYTVKVLTLKE